MPAFPDPLTLHEVPQFYHLLSLCNFSSYHLSQLQLFEELLVYCLPHHYFVYIAKDIILSTRVSWNFIRGKDEGKQFKDDSQISRLNNVVIKKKQKTVDKAEKIMSLFLKHAGMKDPEENLGEIFKTQLELW